MRLLGFGFKILLTVKGLKQHPFFLLCFFWLVQGVGSSKCAKKWLLTADGAPVVGVPHTDPNMYTHKGTPDFSKLSLFTDELSLNS